MLFATHLVGGYIASRILKMPVELVVLGAALPDLIDKPLGILEIAPHYHSIGHSVFTIFFLILVAVKIKILIPVIIGFLTHLCQDALHILINRGLEKTTFIFYPLTFPNKPKITDGSVDFIANFWSNYLWTTGFYIEFVFWGIALYFLYRQRCSLINYFNKLIGR